MHIWLPNLVAKFWLPNLVLYQTVYALYFNVGLANFSKQKGPQEVAYDQCHNRQVLANKTGKPL